MAASAGTHTVKPGDSMWTIAKRYGCSLSQLKASNRKQSKFLRIGQKLKIPDCSKKSAQKTKPEKATQKKINLRKAKYYVVRTGDSLGAIARRRGVSIKKLKRWNNLKSSMIRVGQKIRLYSGEYRKVDRRPVVGQSIGIPSRGRLQEGKQMETTEDWYIRRPHHAFGADHTVYFIEHAASTVRLKFPKLHELSIGDLSDQNGGRLYPHKSHQSGRDADLGFYYTEVPPGYPRTFVKSHYDKFHTAANWLFVRLLLETADQDGGLEAIFLDHKLQKRLYNYAKKHGVSETYLEWAFQYPRPRSVRRGIIRHEPGHDGHYHVRFKCAGDSSHCR